MDFSFYMPTRIVCGKDCVVKNAALFRAFGKRALIVTGKSSAKNGSLTDITTALNANGQEHTVFDEVPNNPTVQSVRKGAALARSFGADFIVAVGGGSPMDAAKAIAMLARQEAADIFSHPIGKDVLPMVHIPTTAGTGSEVTPYAILTNDEKETKQSISAPSLFPQIAFLDGKYMENLPQHVTVNTAIDAISHAVEGMLSQAAGELSDALAREALRILFGEYECLRKGSYSPESRQNLLYGAAVAGMVIANTGTSPVHTLGYSLTYYHGVPHGRANGLLLPAFLEHCLQKDKPRTGRVYAALGMGAEEFSEKLALLLGERERYADAELRSWAHKAAQSRKKCAISFTEEELFAVLKESVGR